MSSDIFTEADFEAFAEARRRDEAEAEEAMRAALANRSRNGQTEHERAVDRLLANTPVEQHEYLLRGSEMLASSAQADLAFERYRQSELREHNMRQIERIKQHNAEREARHRQLAAEQQPDRVDRDVAFQGNPRRDNDWLRLAAGAHAAAAELVIGGERQRSDPFVEEEQRERGNVQTVAKYGRR